MSLILPQELQNRSKVEAAKSQEQSCALSVPGSKCGCFCCSYVRGRHQLSKTSQTARIRAIFLLGCRLFVPMRVTNRGSVLRNNITAPMGSAIVSQGFMEWTVRCVHALRVMHGWIYLLHRTQLMGITLSARIWGTVTGQQANALVALASEGRRVTSCSARLAGHQKGTRRAQWISHAVEMADVSL